MRRIFFEKARQRSSQRREQVRARCELREDGLVVSPLRDELLDLDEALTKLTAIDADAAAVGKLRLFAGVSVEEIAEIQRISPRTVAERTCSATPALSWSSENKRSPNPFIVGRFASLDGARARQIPTQEAKDSGSDRAEFEAGLRVR
jgi:hypothetical protein